MSPLVCRMYNTIPVSLFSNSSINDVSSVFENIQRRVTLQVNWTAGRTSHSRTSVKCSFTVHSVCWVITSRSIILIQTSREPETRKRLFLSTSWNLIHPFHLRNFTLSDYNLLAWREHGSPRKQFRVKSVIASTSCLIPCHKLKFWQPEMWQLYINANYPKGTQRV